MIATVSTLSDRDMSGQMAQCLAVIKHNEKPHTLILYGTRALGDHSIAEKSITSILRHIMRTYDTIKTIARLEFGGLDGKDHKSNRDIEDRVDRVAEKSQAVVWDRHGCKFAQSSSEQLLKSGELRLRLPGKNTEQYGPEVVVKFSEILHEVREVASSGRSLTGNPTPNDIDPLRASVVPLPDFVFGFAACAAQLCGLRGGTSIHQLPSTPSAPPTRYAVTHGSRLYRVINPLSAASYASARRLLGRISRR